jgi:hypothetical protein
MASRLSPTPDEEREAPPSIPAHVKKGVAKQKSKEPPEQKFTKDSDEPITIEQYNAMMQDRPVKFGPKTSGFKRGAGAAEGKPCSHCVHYYNSPIAAVAMGKATHGTCELVRVSDTEDNIEPDDYCHLWSEDGKTLPLLAEHAKKENDEKA